MVEPRPPDPTDPAETFPAPDRADSPERLGGELAALRKTQGMTGEELGRRLRFSQAKVSKVERGSVRVRPRDVERIAKELGAPDDLVEHLVARAARLHARPLAGRLADRRDRSAQGVGLDRDLGTRLPSQDEVADREAAATHLQNFEAMVIPGLLQVGDYTRRILSGYYSFAFGDADAYRAEAAKAVSRRALRQEELYNPEKAFEFVIMESTLSSPLLTPGFMLAQVDRLEQASNLPNVTLRIIPHGAKLLYPPGGGFSILDERAVLLEVGSTPFLIREKTEVNFHRSIFEHYSSAAVEVTSSLLDEYKARYADAAHPRD